MKPELIAIKCCGLLMVSYFVFDAHRKYTLAQDLEGERIRIKFGQFDEWLRGYGVNHGLQDLLKREAVLIVQIFAAIELAAAALFYVGSRLAVAPLIACTLVSAVVLHNPWYVKHTTAIDRQRDARSMFSDLCLCAALLIVAGSKKFRQLRLM